MYTRIHNIIHSEHKRVSLVTRNSTNVRYTNNYKMYYNL